MNVYIYIYTYICVCICLDIGIGHLHCCSPQAAQSQGSVVIFTPARRNAYSCQHFLCIYIYIWQDGFKLRDCLKAESDIRLLGDKIAKMNTFLPAP